MRIGYSCQLIDDRAFGVSNVILQLARALVDTVVDDELIVYGRRVRDELRGADGKPTLQHVSPRPTRHRAGRILWEQFALPRRAKRDELDVFHATGYVMPLAMKVPTVLTLHDLLVFSHPAYCTRANRTHYRLVVPPSVRRARRILTLSTAVREHVRERFGVPAARIDVVPPGIDERFRQVPQEREVADVARRYGLSAPFMLAVGNHEPKKNLARVVDAFRALRERGTIDGELVVTGGGGWGNVLAGREQTPGLRLLPYIPADDLAQLYRAARLLAFPSLAEGFGLPVIEAMATGLPVVASDVPALLESDPDAAVRVEPTSVDSIADGLERAWNDEQLRSELRRRGLAAARPFTWANAARATLDVYRRAVDG